jgi:hypothetical protein
MTSRRWPNRFLAVLAGVLTAASAPAATPDGLRVDEYASCAGTTDATNGMKAALEAARGRTLVIPSGCKLLIASPGVGAAAIIVPSETTIRCEDQTAGFFLARRSCRGGRYPGAACSSDTDCLGGGTCAFDSGSEAFARRDADASFTLLGAAADSVRVAVENCRIWANGTDDYARCRGGTNDGRPCLHACDGNPRLGCDSDQDCVDQKAGTTCSNLADCKTAASPGTCDGASGVPVGAGKVTLIDFSQATDASIDNVAAYDHRRGDLSFSVGGGNAARIRWCDNTARSKPNWPRSFIAPAITQPAWSVTTGARLAGEEGGRLSESKIRGSTVGVSATGSYQTVTNSDIEATDATTSTYGVSSIGLGNHIIANRIRAPGTDAFGVYVDRLQQIVAMNNIGGWGCARSGATRQAGNVTFAQNRCFGGAGPKIVATGAGWTIVNNYLGWGTAQRGVLELGSTETKAIGTSHLVASGNLFHSDQPGAAAVKLVDVGRRCKGGSKVDERCSTNDCDAATGCPGATGCPASCAGTCCAGTVHEDVNLTGNTFLAGEVGVDASLTSGGTRIASLTIANNVGGQLLKSSVKLPADDTLVSGLLISANNFAPSTAPLENFKWSMGTASGNTPESPSVDSLEIVPLTNASGSALAPGDVVEIATVADSAVTRAAAGSTRPIGIAVTGAASGTVERVAVRGTTSCNTTDVGVARGDRLIVSTTAGKLAPARPDARAFAIALSARSTGERVRSVRCLLLP